MGSVIINQRIDSFLEHTHFVVDNNFRSIKIKKFLETIITVDHTTIEVIKIGGSKATARERDHWTEVWWNNWNHSKDKVSWFNTSIFHTFKNFNTLN